MIGMSTRVKSALKSRLTPDQLDTLGRWRQKLGPACVRALSVLPADQLVAIKDGLQVEGRLDYPRGDIRMHLTSRREWGRLYACQKEPETVEWLEQNLRPGDVFFDVGANVGAYSFVADSVAKGLCRVFAFEPSFSTFAALSRNVQINNLSDRISPFQVALTDRTGLVDFQYRDIAPGAADHSLTIAPGNGAFSPMHHQATLGYRMDDFVPAFKLPIPNLMKIDVDGGEQLTVSGAQSILADKSLRSVLIEIDETLCSRDQLLASLEKCGLRLRAQYPRGRSTSANHVLFRE